MKIVTIKHKDVTAEILNDIISIKQQAWAYSYEEQMNWLIENIKDQDIHVLLKDDQNSFVAYLNLIQTNITINDVEISVSGVGNVCAKTPGKGYGSLLMKKTCNYLIENNESALLFCKENLVSFYQTFGFHLMKPEILNIPKLTEGIFTMIFNIQSPKNIEYSQKLF